MRWLDRLKSVFGRRGKVDLLIRALPNPGTILAHIDAWAAVVVTWGDRVEAWDADESRVLAALERYVSMAQVVGGLIDADGAAKLAAVSTQLRAATAAIKWSDDRFDAFWIVKGRPILEEYIAARKATEGLK